MSVDMPSTKKKDRDSTPEQQSPSDDGTSLRFVNLDPSSLIDPSSIKSTNIIVRSHVMKAVRRSQTSALLSTPTKKVVPKGSPKLSAGELRLERIPSRNRALLLCAKCQDLGDRLPLDSPTAGRIIGRTTDSQTRIYCTNCGEMLLRPEGPPQLSAVIGATDSFNSLPLPFQPSTSYLIDHCTVGVPIL